jgi:hypothetical protein
MKELFVPKNFGAAARSMIGTVNNILAEYQASGYDLTVRQLYYQLVSRDIIPNNERSYKNTVQLVSDARLAGLIDWEIIKDRGRTCIENPHWETPADIVRSAAYSFKMDHWIKQDNYVEVMVEKQALEGVLIPVCQKLDIPFTANKGYSSSSAMYEASKRYIAAAEAGKNLYVLYLGDHDPSGIDMTRDIDERLDLFIKTSHNDEQSIQVNRLALNMDQVRRFKPPENPAKITDSRAESYIRKFGKSSWELDAIEPKRLASLVENAVTELIDQDEWDRSHGIQDKHKAELLKYSDNYGK